MEGGSGSADILEKTSREEVAWGEPSWVPECGDPRNPDHFKFLYASHGGTTPHSTVVKEYSEYLCFLFKELDVTLK
jgi:hypothetical protein